MMRKKIQREVILVTGATGFIGRPLVQRLADAGQEVCCVILPTESVSVHGQAIAVDIVRDDIVAAMARYNVTPQKIIHLAAYVDSRRDYQTARRVIDDNVIGTLNLLEAASRWRVKLFLHMGTEEVYGDAETPYKESGAVSPQTPYAISKYASERFANMYQLVRALPVVMVRCAAIYGPGQNGSKLIPASIGCALRNESIVLHSSRQRRSFLYIDDAVEALTRICYAAKMVSGHIFNIAGRELFYIEDIVNKIIALTSSASTIRQSSEQSNASFPSVVMSDIKKAKTMLNWEPGIPLDLGLRKTVEWYKRQNMISTG